MWILFAFGSAFFAGFTAVLAKCGIKNMDSNVATALRTVVVLLFSWMMVFLSGTVGMIVVISEKTWLFLILSGLATGASWLCYFKALQIGDVNKVTPIDKSSTVLTMLLAFVFLGERISLVKIVAMVLIGTGTYLMIQKREASISVKTKVRRTMEADFTEEYSNPEKEQKTAFALWKRHSWIFYAFASTIFASLTSILGKIGIEGIDSNLGTAIRTVVVLIMAWIVVFVTGKQHTVKDTNTKNWLFLILSGVATGGSWLCYYRALQTGPASVVVPIDKLSILVTIAFSFVVLKEKLNVKSTVGLVSIVAGTLILLV
ncbi:EamA family transporter [Anaerocolumna sp. MB42-C2]|uniref:EamA family transporter n=1 Tax=Anaerocolumna sp. MB42-C2 TaxID=3070997 RepID=UPI0027E120F8|nr:EamA family transporter [Anaerocolumna sp. MB42-C2]WMJ86783.1 EamA family transporter [Anaerocolumna sp. MB42-C2]